MYLIPLGLIVMNAMTQAMNLPEEQATGQSGCPAGSSNPAWAQSCCETTMMGLNCPSIMHAFNSPIRVELMMGF
ncbi:hypothetical protein OIU78_022729 [Salix suchowensis]|nr:hypothetical protein OIU78_022729 [Salix suchowensis]